MKRPSSQGSALDPERDSHPFHPFTRCPEDDYPLAEREAEPRYYPGGDYRIRTDDPLLAKQVLYQLS